MPLRHVTKVILQEELLPNPANYLVENLRTNGAEQDQRQRRISLDKINDKMTKRRQSLPALPSYFAVILSKKKRSAKKERKEVTFPVGVVLQQVISEGEVEELKEILEKEGNHAVEERDPNGVPPIVRAIIENQMDCLKVLLAAGANLMIEDPEEWNAFHVASAMDNIDAVKMILESGGQHRGITQSRNVNGDRAIDLAESLEMARFLLHADLAEFRLDCANVEKHTSYTEKSEAQVLQFVMDYFKIHSNPITLNDILKEKTSYSSLLHLAATKNYSRLADCICMNFSPSLELRDNRGWTALHTAAYYNNLDMALFLVEKGANVHTITRSYQKPLDLTEHELIQCLMEEQHIITE